MYQSDIAASFYLELELGHPSHPTCPPKGEGKETTTYPLIGLAMSRGLFEHDVMHICKFVQSLPL